MKFHLMSWTENIVGEFAMFRNGVGKHLELVSEPNDADIVLVMVLTEFGGKYNPILDTITKPIVILDYLEYGGNFDKEETHVVGKNFNPLCCNEDWQRLHNFVTAAQPVLYFKRELLKKDQTKHLLPIEYWTHTPEHEIVSKEDFDKRRLEVLHFWGLSHVSRPKLHADIFSNYEGHYDFVGAWNHIDWYMVNSRYPLWASIHTPHFDRAHETILQRYMEQSKITVSLQGNGRKCFRSAEACCYSIMAQQCDLAFSYPWDETNSIVLREGRLWDDLSAATKRTDLYEVYVNGINNAKKYRPCSYAREYLTKKIEEAL